MKIQTAEELCYNSKYNDSGLIHYKDAAKLCVQFAKLHVKEALEEALESIPCLGSSTDIATYEEVREAVLNSYSDERIK
jgi:hypothetical protein